MIQPALKAYKEAVNSAYLRLEESEGKALKLFREASKPLWDDYLKLGEIYWRTFKAELKEAWDAYKEAKRLDQEKCSCKKEYGFVKVDGKLVCVKCLKEKKHEARRIQKTRMSILS